MYRDIVADRLYVRNFTPKQKETEILQYLFSQVFFFIWNICSIVKWNIWAERGADIKHLRTFMGKITESLENSRTPPVTAFNVKHGFIPQLLPNAGAGE